MLLMFGPLAAFAIARWVPPPTDGPDTRRVVRAGHLLDMIEPGARGWNAVPPADRAAVERAKAELDRTEDTAERAAILERLYEGVSLKPLRRVVAADLAVALSKAGRHADAADVYDDLTDLVTSEEVRRETVRDRAAALAKAGRGDEAAALLRTLPSARPAGPGGDRRLQSNFEKARGLIAAGDVTAGTQDYLSRAPAGEAGERLAGRYLALGGLLAGKVLAQDPAAGVRFQAELFKKFPGAVGAGELWNAAARFEQFEQDGPAARLLDRILETEVDTEYGASVAAKRATDAFDGGDRQTAVRYARMVLNNPSASADERREMQNFLLGADVSVYELEEPLGAQLKPRPDPAFSDPAPE